MCDDIDYDIKRPRGRPRKNQNNYIDIKNQKTKIKKTFIQQNDQDEEIILHLPISFNETLKDITTEPSDKKESEIQDSDTECSVKNQYSDDPYVTRLQNELNESRRIIQDLTSSLTKFSKDSKITNMNLQFDIQVQDTSPHCCWWCTEPFDTLPCFIPEKYVNNTWYVFGVFCSYDCALAYNINLGDYKVWTRISLIYRLCELIFGENCKPKIAPPRETLTKFGGHLSLEDYRINSQLCNKEYRLLLPPMVSIVPVVEEISKYVNNFSSSEDFKVKRSKALPGHSNILESLKVKN
jgi:hypothetical protein